MQIIIKHPIRAYLLDYSNEELQDIRKQLTYHNTSISFQLGKVKQMNWLRKKDPEAWQQRVDELQAQIISNMVYEDKEGLYIRPGSIPYLSNNVEIVNLIEYPQFKPFSWEEPPRFKPYDYQIEAVKNLLQIRHGNVDMATGLGKSLVLLLLAQLSGLRSVVITPSKSIFNELLVEFQKRLGTSIVGGYGDGKKDIKKPVTIAIGKSLTMLQPGTPAYNFFANKQMMLTDEAHCFGADQLEKVAHEVLQTIPYRFFVTATPTRGDGKEKLLFSIIGKTVLKKTIEEGIDQGFLCPLQFTILPTFSPSNSTKKDPIECKREHFLYNKEIAKLSAKLANANWLVKQESTLILVEELIQIKVLADLLKVPFSYVHSGNKAEASDYGLNVVKLQQEVDRFNRGEVKVLIGTRAIATGTNIYPTHNTINWMGGGSEISTKQGPMGRSTRKLEISDYSEFHKPKLFTQIYDFDVAGQPILKGQLKKRIEYYKETGKKVNIYK